MVGKILLFAFGLVAEIEKNLISQRTKEALALRKAQGIILGRPRGSCPKYKELIIRRKEIETMLGQKLSKKEIAERMNVSRPTLYKFLNSLDLLFPL